MSAPDLSIVLALALSTVALCAVSALAWYLWRSHQRDQHVAIEQTYLDLQQRQLTALQRDDDDALERLADVLHAWDKTAAPPAAPRHILPAPGAARCTIAEALLRPARAVRMRDAVGETAAEYLWAYPPGVPLVAPGEEVTAELVTACRALEQAGTALKHTGGSGAEEIAVL